MRAFQRISKLWDLPVKTLAIRFRLLTLLVCGLLAACSLADFPPVFIGKAPNELPYRLKSYIYLAYRQRTPYQAASQYQYDTQNRLTRLDSPDEGQSTIYLYDNNRLSERITYSGRSETNRTCFFYNADGQLERTAAATAPTATPTYLFDNANQLVERTVAYPSAPGFTCVTRSTCGVSSSSPIFDGYVFIEP